MLSCVLLFATPWTITCQSPLSMEFFRQEYRNVSQSGDWTHIPCLVARFFLITEPPGKPHHYSLLISLLLNFWLFPKFCCYKSHIFFFFFPLLYRIPEVILLGQKLCPFLKFILPTCFSDELYQSTLLLAVHGDACLTGTSIHLVILDFTIFNYRSKEWKLILEVFIHFITNEASFYHVLCFPNYFAE